MSPYEFSWICDGMRTEINKDGFWNIMLLLCGMEAFMDMASP